VSGPRGLLAAADRVGLRSLGDADLQRRVDRKYLLPLDLLAEVAPELTATHALLEVDGRTSFHYRSCYLDTPDLACFHAHRQDRRLRWKARTRLYADSGLCRFEVKLKTGRGDTDKHAQQIGREAFGTVPASGRAVLDRALAERYGVRGPQSLGPTLEVHHRRSTLVAHAASERLTVDWDLGFTGPDGGAGALRSDLALVETKSRDGRSRADLLLRDAGARPVSVSKYTVGMALTRPSLPDQPWRPLLRRCFTTTPAAAVAA
jgi:hypothetical protein